jgi:hypothetical protein
MKKLVLLFSIFLCSNAFSQTHLTVNKEKCWIVKKIEDPMGSSFLIVVVEESGTTEEKNRIEKILQSKLKASIPDRLTAEGFRVEMFRKEDLQEIKRTSLSK